MESISNLGSPHRENKQPPRIGFGSKDRTVSSIPCLLTNSGLSCASIPITTSQLPPPYPLPFRASWLRRKAVGSHRSRNGRSKRSLPHYILRYVRNGRLPALGWQRLSVVASQESGLRDAGQSNSAKRR